MSRHLRVAVAPLLALASTSVAAQVPATPPPVAGVARPAGVSTADSTRFRAAVVSANRDPTLTSIVRSPVNALRFVAETDSKAKTVQAQVGWLGRRIGGSTVGADLRFEGPLDEGNAETSLADLTGLANATTAGVGLTLFRWRPRVDVPVLTTVCAELRSEYEKDPARAKFFEGRRADDITWCFSGSRDVKEADWPRLDPAVAHAGVPFTLAAAGKLGRKRFDYVDPASLASATSRETPYSVGVALGWFFPRASVLISPSMEWARSADAAGTRQLCTPLGGGGAQQCRNAVLGPPSVTDHAVAGLEVRKFVSPELGLTLRVRRDLEERVTSVELPIYFLRSSNVLNGGVSAGWRSDTKTFGLAVFVGAMASPVVQAP